MRLIVPFQKHTKVSAPFLCCCFFRVACMPFMVEMESTSHPPIRRCASRTFVTLAEWISNWTPLQYLHSQKLLQSIVQFQSFDQSLIQFSNSSEHCTSVPSLAHTMPHTHFQQSFRYYWAVSAHKFCNLKLAISRFLPFTLKISIYLLFSMLKIAIVAVVPLFQDYIFTHPVFLRWQVSFKYVDTVFCSLFCGFTYSCMDARAFYPFFAVLMISVCIAIMSMLFLCSVSFLFIASDWKTFVRSERERIRKRKRMMWEQWQITECAHEESNSDMNFLSFAFATLHRFMLSRSWSSFLCGFFHSFIHCSMCMHARNNWTPEIVFAKCLSMHICSLCVNSDSSTRN